MCRIYKLIDSVEKEDIQKNSRISLSRPLLSFGPPEGLIIDFFRDIRKLEKQFPDMLQMKPTEDILRKIRDWYILYYHSLPGDKKIKYKPCDVRSDLQIAMCQYFQTYCGYFTYADLDDPQTRKEYLEKNSKFIQKQGKKAYIKIDIPENELDNIWWECPPPDPESDFVFKPSSPDREWNNNIVAALHLHDVMYLENDFSAVEILKQFNQVERRNFSCWFKFTKEYFSSQQEKRLIFHLPDIKPNSARMACDDLFPGISYDVLEEALFYDAVSTLQYALRDGFPKYVYLAVKEFEIVDLV